MFDVFAKQMWQAMFDKRISLKKKDLAERIGISVNQLRDFVKGRYRPHSVAEKIADFLGMAMVYMDGRYQLYDKEKIRMG